MNILVTGASRGIGAATFDLLRNTGHSVAGHSTAGSDELIAADFTDPAVHEPCGIGPIFGITYNNNGSMNAADA